MVREFRPPPNAGQQFLFSCLQFNDDIIAVGDIQDSTIKIWDLHTGASLVMES